MQKIIEPPTRQHLSTFMTLEKELSLDVEENRLPSDRLLDVNLPNKVASRC